MSVLLVGMLPDDALFTVDVAVVDNWSFSALQVGRMVLGLAPHRELLLP